MGDGWNVNAQRAIVAFVCGALFGGAWPQSSLSWRMAYYTNLPRASGRCRMQSWANHPSAAAKKIGLHSYLKLQE